MRSPTVSTRLDGSAAAVAAWNGDGRRHRRARPARGRGADARILAIRAFDASARHVRARRSRSSGASTGRWRSGARVINMSFAGPYDPEIARSLAAAKPQGRRAGRRRRQCRAAAAPLYPAADPNVIAVTAVDARDEMSRFSVQRPPCRDCALRASMWSGRRRAGPTKLSTGTSVAAAHVSGIAALLIELRPTLTPKAVRNLLLSTARDFGSRRDATTSYGAGLADAYRAAAAISATARAPARTSAAR